jgi:low affinity Fe/Cu permease
MGNDVQRVKPGRNGEGSRLYNLGCDISAWVSDFSAHPYAQFGLVIFCVGWFALGFDTNLLTAALSILAISLTQMVLNRQNQREAEARRRDVAMHAKLDELIIAARRAHNEMAGIEDLPEETIAELKEQQLQLINGEKDGTDPSQREKGTD